jgi:hypothetical protein
MVMGCVGSIKLWSIEGANLDALVRMTVTFFFFLFAFSRSVVGAAFEHVNVLLPRATIASVCDARSTYLHACMSACPPARLHEQSC